MDWSLAGGGGDVVVERAGLALLELVLGITAGLLAGKVIPKP